MDLETTSQIRNSATLPPNTTSKQRYAVLTWLICAICIVVFLGLLNESNSESWEVLERWGCYPSSRIYEGAYWALLTSVFVHLEFWHAGFNVYWLYLFGAPFERVLGWRRFLLFFILAALVSSAAQLAVSGQTGIGASGVVYAIFGFLWMTRKCFSGFQAVLDSRTTTWFLIWLIACFVMSWAKVWEVGNAAHSVGLLFGVGVGGCVSHHRYRRPIIAGLAMMSIGSLATLFWAPLSSEWTSAYALHLHRKGEYFSAIRWYERSLKLGQDKTWCWENIALAYGSIGAKSNYHQALRTLRGLNQKAADEIEKEINSQTR